MALTSQVRVRLNRILSSINVQVETLTKRRLECERLRAFHAAGRFERPVFKILQSFPSCKADSFEDALRRYASAIKRLEEEVGNEVGYTIDNTWFTSPDAEIYYVLIRTSRPQSIIEVGSGFSTKIARQAIRDAGLSTVLTSIDPEPRSGIDALCDVVIRKPLQTTDAAVWSRGLQANDIIFIDSSHEVKIGNDVVFIFSEILDELAPGVLVHFHDIFLPFEYPLEWAEIFDPMWSDQYLVQVLLQFSDRFDVVWPGHYLQRMDPNFAARFPTLRQGRAQSLWLRKLK